MGEPRRVLIDGALLQEAEALGLAVGLHSSSRVLKNVVWERTSWR